MKDRLYCAYCIENNETKERKVIHSLESEDDIIEELLKNNSRYTLVSTTVLTKSKYYNFL